MTSGVRLVIMLSILENSGIRRQRFPGVVDGAIVRGGPVLVFGKGLVPKLLDPLPGNSGTWARLLTWCGV